MSLAYRSAYEHIVGLKLEETREARQELAPHLPKLRKIVRARLTRIVAGSVGIAGAFAMAMTAALTSHDEPTDVMLGASAALVFAWIAGRFLFSAGAKLAKPDEAEPRLTGELNRDLELLGARDARREATALEARCDRLETASLALPMIGISFLMPLFLHWCVGKAVFHGGDDYGFWIRASLAIVGHAHIALAILCYLFARKLHRSDLATMSNLKMTREWAKIWLIVIGVSCVPGILFFVVPPLIVAVTGIAFIPFMLGNMKASVQKERVWIAAMHPESYDNQPVFPAPPATPAPSAEQQQREADRDDQHDGADTGDRAQA